MYKEVQKVKIVEITKITVDNRVINTMYILAKLIVKNLKVELKARSFPISAPRPVLRQQFLDKLVANTDVRDDNADVVVDEPGEENL